MAIAAVFVSNYLEAVQLSRNSSDTAVITGLSNLLFPFLAQSNAKRAARIAAQIGRGR